MAALTPEEKLKVKQRNNFKFLCGSVRSAWSFNNARTWKDIYKKLGYDEIAINSGEMKEKKDKPVSFQELNEYLKVLEVDMEKRLNEPKAIPIPSSSTEEVVEESNNPASNSVSIKGAESNAKESSEPEPEGFTSANDYGLISADGETARLFWFQKKACSELLLLFGLE